MNPVIRKETGPATYAELLRFKRALDRLIRDLSSKAEALASTGTGTGPVGGLTTVSADGRYLRLDASNDPVTGALTLSSDLWVSGKTTLSGTQNVVGAVQMDSTLAVTGNVSANANLTVSGLHTGSDMVHLAAPSTGVANLRMRSFASYTTLSPDSGTLSGHELWFRTANITASDGNQVLAWASDGTPFSADLFTADSRGPIYKATAGPNSLPCVTLSTSATNDYVDSGTDHTIGVGDGQGCTLFLVYKTSTGGVTGERGIVGRASGETSGGPRPPGAAASAFFSFQDQATGTRTTVSDPVTTSPSTSQWCIAVMRKDASNVWYNILGLAAGVERCDDGYTATTGMNLKGIGLDGNLNPFAGCEVAEIIAYNADLGTTATDRIYNYLAERYSFPVIAGSAGAQTDHILAQTSDGANVFRVDTNGACAVGGTTISSTLNVYGTVYITGATVITAALTATGLSISGLSTLSDTDVQALSAASLAVSGRSTLSRTKVDSLFLDDNKKITLGTGLDCEIYYDGTDLQIRPNVVGTGDVYISDGTNNIKMALDSGIYIDGYQNKNLNIQRFSSGDLYLCRGAGGVSIGGNTPVSGANLTVETGHIDCKSPYYVRGGARERIQWGKNNAGGATYFSGPDGVDMTAVHGSVVARSGSVISIAASNDAAVMAVEDTISYVVQKNGTPIVTLSVYSTITNTFATYARGLYTFTAGDVLTGYFSPGASWNGNVDLIMGVEIVVDS